MRPSHRTHKIRRWFNAACLGLSIGSLPAFALAELPEDFPSKPIRMIVPVNPGGPGDEVARVLGRSLSNVLGQPVVVENRGGASSTIGTAFVARARKDGYTLLIAVDSHASNQFLFKGLPYDPVQDFAPVAYVGAIPAALMAGPALPDLSFSGVIKQLKEKPQSISFASQGVGSYTYLSARQLENAAGVTVLHVPFSGGGETLNAFLSGQVSMMFASLTTGATLVQQKKVRILAIVSPERSPNFPSIPTMRDLGYPQINLSLWFGVFAPIGTPDSVISKLSGAVEKALSDPDTRSKLAQMQMIVDYQGPVQFKGFLRDEIDKRGRLIRDEGITPTEPK